MAVQHIDETQFEELIHSGKTVLVDFYADWCGPCKMQAPILDILVEELNEEQTVAKLNVDENQDVAAKYGVMSIPTLLVFKDGEVVNKAVGVQNKEALVQLFASSKPIA